MKCNWKGAEDPGFPTPHEITCVQKEEPWPSYRNAITPDAFKQRLTAWCYLYLQCSTLCASIMLPVFKVMISTHVIQNNTSISHAQLGIQTVEENGVKFSVW